MNDIKEKAKLNIDGVEYFMDDLSDAAKSQIENINFSDNQILQLKNELAISKTAKRGYLELLTAELSQIKKANH